MDIIKQSIIDDLKAFDLILQGFEKSCETVGYNESVADVVNTQFYKLKISIQQFFKEFDNEK